MKYKIVGPNGRSFFPVWNPILKNRIIDKKDILFDEKYGIVFYRCPKTFKTYMLDESWLRKVAGAPGELVKVETNVAKSKIK